MVLGYFQKDELIEKLAKNFYAVMGYVVRDDYRMQSGNHPIERACVKMAINAIEELSAVFIDSDDDDDDC
jgi:hypothetical protein